jgi:hypothetical protein
MIEQFYRQFLFNLRLLKTGRDLWRPILCGSVLGQRRTRFQNKVGGKDVEHSMATPKGARRGECWRWKREGARVRERDDWQRGRRERNAEDPQKKISYVYMITRGEHKMKAETEILGKRSSRLEEQINIKGWQIAGKRENWHWRRQRSIGDGTGKLRYNSSRRKRRWRIL